MSLKALEIALEAGQDLMRRLDALRAALEAGQDDVALDMAREITGAKRPAVSKKAVRREIEKSNGDITDQYLRDDDDRLLRCNDAVKLLANMPKTTFYRNIQRGIIPKPRYMGKTPVWRLGDLRNVYNQLPCNPANDER